MKRILLLLLMMLLPISVMAKEDDRSSLFQLIESIQNVYVDENIKILSVEVDSNNIKMEIEEDNVVNTHLIPYTFDDQTLSFQSGYLTIQKGDSVSIEDIKDNSYAFYLYSILESKSSSIYEEDNYYNESLILKKLNSYSIEEWNELWSDGVIEYHNIGKTFGLVFKSKVLSDSSIRISIVYEYFLDGDNSVLMNSLVDSKGLTGEYHSFITILLLVVLGMAVYSCIGVKVRRKS